MTDAHATVAKPPTTDITVQGLKLIISGTTLRVTVSKAILTRRTSTTWKHSLTWFCSGAKLAEVKTFVGS